MLAPPSEDLFTWYQRTCNFYSEFAEGMHGCMERDVALAAVHCADPRGCCHVDAIG